MAQFHLHPHAHFAVEVDDCIEILGQVGIPGPGALDQQALERQIKQFYRPSASALAQFGGGVEVYALKTSAFFVIAHGRVLG